MSKKLPAIHPGEILREEFMKPMGLSSTALANALGVTPARINEIVREKRGISADTALRLARFFGTDAQSWLNRKFHRIQFIFCHGRYCSHPEEMRS